MPIALRFAILLVLCVPAFAGAADPKLPAGAVAFLGRADEKDNEDGNEVIRVHFSHDGKYLWVHRWHGITLYETPTFKVVWELQPPPKQRWRDFCISPDGKTFVTGRFNNSTQVWDFASRQEIAQIPRPTDHCTIRYITYISNDLIIIAVTHGQELEGYVSLWDITVRGEVKRAEWKSEQALCPRIVMPDGLREALIHAGKRDAPLVQSISLGADGKKNVWGKIGGRILGVSSDGRFAAHTVVVPLASNPDGIKMPEVYRHDFTGWVMAITELESGRERSRLPFVNRGRYRGLNEVLFLHDNRSFVTIDYLTGVQLWETASAQVRQRLEVRANQKDACRGGAISPDGHWLATIGAEGVVIWSLGAMVEPSGSELTPARLESLWGEMTGTDAVKAYRAIQLLAAGSNVVPFLAPAATKPTVLGDRIAKDLANLDSPQFAVREQATARLIQVGEDARGTLQTALLRDNRSAESAQRIRTVLAKLPKNIGRSAPIEEITASRVAELLELIGSKESKELLKTFSVEQIGRPLGREAAASLDRIEEPTKRH